MKEPNYLDSYNNQRIVLFASTGSAALISTVLLLLFLGSQISDHPPVSTDTISEMMGYAEFFLFAFASYFSVALFTSWKKNIFSRLSASWLPIAMFGSIVFSFSFMFRVWVSAKMTYREGNPYQNRPGSFLFLLAFALAVGVVISIITGVCCYVASFIVGTNKSDDSLLRITQKY